MDPARVWRGDSPSAELAPGPWPSRVEAFMCACAIHAGQREQDLITIVEGIGEAAKNVGKPGGGFKW